MSHPVRWGIIGPGGIAGSFAACLRSVPGASLTAVASRDARRAAAFTATWGGRACRDIADLLGDPGVDAVYVATPHPQHHALAKQCLEAGKAVLCEKPITINAAQCADLIATARRHGVFLMEAMWTRFLPCMAQVRAWLASGEIGEPRLLTADFGFRCDWDPGSRLLDLQQGGGGLLDVGVYLVSFADMVFAATPQRVSGFAHVGPTGVDEQGSLSLGYPGGALASLTYAIRTATNQTAVIYGTEGRIEIPSFWNATTAHLLRTGAAATMFTRPHLGNGYEWQAMEVARCLGLGLVESPFMPWAESLSIQRSMEDLRRSWDMQYPGEDAVPGRV